MNEAAQENTLTAIVLPTYNEAENIGPLIEEILARGAGRNLRVIVVDDGSPDGTGAIVRALSEREGEGGRSRIELIERGGKLGLGTAYIAGLRRAMERGAKWVCTMDADFSHNPAHLPQILDAARGADLAIGSRYVAGGGVRNWPLHRRFLSAGANWTARLVLGLASHDCTSGYRCYRVDFLRKIALEEIRSDGYSFLIDLLFRCRRAGARIVECPIVFTDRRGGVSKISKTEIVKAIKTLWRLYFN